MDESRISRSLRAAWTVWLALVLVTQTALLATVVTVFRRSPAGASTDSAVRWAGVIAAYYILIVPIAFWRTGWLFRGYYHGHAVRPQSYVRGMSIVWAALAIGAWLAMAVCMATRTFLPNILLAGVGNVTLLTLWPKGNAMTPPAGNPQDPGVYEEPR